MLGLKICFRLGIKLLLGSSGSKRFVERVSGFISSLSYFIIGSVEGRLLGGVGLVLVQLEILRNSLGVRLCFGQ